LDRAYLKRGLKARVICNVHDAIMTDTPQEEEKECIKIMKEICIEPPIPLRVPLLFEIKSGPNWNELKEIK